jgi:hypothetical protein
MEEDNRLTSKEKKRSIGRRKEHLEHAKMRTLNSIHRKARGSF